MAVFIYSIIIILNLVGAGLAVIAVRNSKGLVQMDVETPGYYRRRAWGWLAMHLLYLLVASLALMSAL